MRGFQNHQIKLFIVAALSVSISGFILPAAAQQTFFLDDAATVDSVLVTSLSHLSRTEVANDLVAVSSDARIVLSISQRQVSLFHGETLIDSYPVAVGATETPTPQGEFTVSQMVIEPLWQSPWTGVLHEPGPDSALGLRWIGFTTTSAGSFGFHGTPTVSSIGHAVSNGCVRMYNEDIVALFVQVKIGTPVIVTP